MNSSASTITDKMCTRTTALHGGRLALLPLSLASFPCTVVLDFDQTITVHDTIMSLANKAYDKKPGFRPPFSYFSNIYGDAYTDYVLKNNYIKQLQQQHSPSAKLSLQELYQREMQYQIGLKNIELISVNAIEEKNLFKDVSVADFRSIAKTIDLRPGIKQFLLHCIHNNVPVYILSVNWSTILINEVIDRIVPRKKEIKTDTRAIFDDCNQSEKNYIKESNVTILANEYEFTTNGLCTGHLSPTNLNIRTGYDKLQQIKNTIIPHLQKMEQGHDFVNVKGPLVYVGDSRSDLLPSIACDIPIFITSDIDNSFLATAAKLTDVQVKPLLNEKKTDWLDEMEKEKGDGGKQGNVVGGIKTGKIFFAENFTALNKVFFE